MLDKGLEKIIMEFYEIPAAPFCVKAKSEYVKEYLKEKGLQYEETPYYISSIVNRSDPGKKILFISHLDHPGFIFKNSKEAIALGTLYLDRIKKFAPISVYSPLGKYLGDVELNKTYGLGERNIEVSSDFYIPKNSQGLWNVGNTKFTKEKILGRSHDNDMATAIMLYNLKGVKNSSHQIQFVFTKHEEVLQQSSFNISKNNSLNIGKDDIVLNLESMKVYPITRIKEFSKLNYEDGPVLNISEKSCIYNTKGKNIAESMINNISEKESIKIQRGLAGGTTDARAIVDFGLTNNVVTLNIPNRYKHNSDGEKIRLEEVLIKDVVAVSKIVECVLNSSNLDLSESEKDIPLEKRKEVVKNRKGLYILNNRLNIASRNIVKRGYHYPENLLDMIKDSYWKLLSYIYYFINNGIGDIRVSKE